MEEIRRGHLLGRRGNRSAKAAKKLKCNFLNTWTSFNIGRRDRGGATAAKNRKSTSATVTDVKKSVIQGKHYILEFLQIYKRYNFFIKKVVFETGSDNYKFYKKLHMIWCINIKIRCFYDLQQKYLLFVFAFFLSNTEKIFWLRHLSWSVAKSSLDCFRAI